MIERSSIHLGTLVFLFALFCCSVLAQVIQYTSPVSFLPEFEAFQSGALEYKILLLCQLAILAWCVYLINAIWRASIVPSFKKAQCLLIFGLIYFVFMTFRLVAGFTFAAEGSWLNNPIPSTFHIVLSLFVLCHGHYHWQRSRRKS